MREVAEHLHMGHSVIRGLQERVRATGTAARFVSTACFVNTARFVTNDLAINRAATVPFLFKDSRFNIISLSHQRTHIIYFKTQRTVTEFTKVT